MSNLVGNPVSSPVNASGSPYSSPQGGFRYTRGVATVKLSSAVKDALERYLKRSGETHQEVLEHALRHYLHKQGEPISITDTPNTSKRSDTVATVATVATEVDALALLLLEQHAHLASVQGQHPLAVRMALHAVTLAITPRTLTRLLETLTNTPAAWLATLPSAHKTVTALAFSPDGRWLVSIGRDQRGYVWDWRKREIVAQFATVSSVSSALAFSPDGRYVAVGSGSALELFALLVEPHGVSVRLLQTPLHGHKAWLVSVAFDPSGRFVASASHDKHVRLWDVSEHAAASLPIGQHEDWVTCVAFNDGHRTDNNEAGSSDAGSSDAAHNNRAHRAELRLASGGANGSVVLYALQAGLPEGASEPAVIETDHRSIAEDERAYAHVPLASEPWQLEPLEVLYGHSAPVRSLLFVGDTLFSADADGVLMIWNKTGDMLFSNESAAGIAALARLDLNRLDPDAAHHWASDWAGSSSDGSAINSDISIVSVHDDGYASLWRWHKNNLELLSRQALSSQRQPHLDREHLPATSFDNPTPHGDTPHLPDLPLAFASTTGASTTSASTTGASTMRPWAQVWASGSSDGSVTLWQPQQQHPLATSRLLPLPVTALVTHPHAPLAAISQGTDLVLWDMHKQRTLARLQGHRSSIKSVAFSPDGRYLASASADRTVRLWQLTTSPSDDTATDVTASLQSTLQAHNNVVLSVAFSADGRYLASGGVDGSIIIWSLPTATPLLTLRGQLNWVEGLAFAPHGDYLASVSGSTLLLWDVTAWQQGQVSLWRDPMRGNYDAMLALAILTGELAGRLLTAAGVRLLLWDEHGHLEQELERVHSDTITCLAVHPEGDYWATAGFDGQVWLWHAPSRQPLACLGTHRDVVQALAFSADGRSLLSAGTDKTLWQWQIGVDSWLAAAEARAGQPLSADEWAKALPDVPFVAAPQEKNQ